MGGASDTHRYVCTPLRDEWVEVAAAAALARIHTASTHKSTVSLWPIEPHGTCYMLAAQSEKDTLSAWKPAMVLAWLRIKAHHISSCDVFQCNRFGSMRKNIKINPHRRLICELATQRAIDYTKKKWNTLMLLLLQKKLCDVCPRICNFRNAIAVISEYPKVNLRAIRKKPKLFFSLFSLRAGSKVKRFPWASNEISDAFYDCLNWMNRMSRYFFVNHSFRFCLQI